MRFSIFLIVLVHVSCLVAIGQPIKKHGPSEVYNVEDIIEGKNGRLFLSAAGGLYYSDDVGDTWQHVEASLNTIYFHPYLSKNYKNGDLYAWDLEDGIFSTSDNGATWTPHFVPLPNNDKQVKALGIDGDTLFIGTNNGLYHAQGTDFVKNPTAISALQNNEVTSIHVDGETIVVGTKSNKIFVSGDLGKQWENKSNGLPDGFEVRGFTAAGSTWYVYSTMMGVYKSTDRGSNWSPKNTGLAVSQAAKVFVDGDHLYVAAYSYQNVYRSDLGDGPWVLIDAGIPDLVLPNTIYARGDNIIVGGWHGVFKSKNGGNAYERSQNGITDAFVLRSLEVASDGTIWASGSHTGFYRMAPGEETFSLLPGFFWSGNFGSALLMGDVLPIVQDYKVTLYNVVDKTWGLEYQPFNVPLPDKFLQTNEGIFLSSRTDGVFRYTGSTFWTPFNTGLVSTAVTDLVDTGDKMIAATEDGLYIRGAADPQWERISFSTQDQGVRRLLIQGDRYILTANDFNVYLSIDAGQNWKLVQDLKSKGVTAYAVADNDALYAAAFSAIFISLDGGEHWVKRDLPRIEINSMVVKGEKLFLGTLEQGIWSTSLKIDQEIAFTNIPETINPDSPYTLSATTPSGLPITYTVVSGPGSIQGNVLTPTGVGDIVVRASQAGSTLYNPSATEYTFRVETVTGIENEQEVAVKVYPNPAGQTIHVVLGNMSDNGSVRLISPRGQILHSGQVQGLVEIPAANLPSGIYYLQYSNSKTTITKKVVKN